MALGDVKSVIIYKEVHVNMYFVKVESYEYDGKDYR